MRAQNPPKPKAQHPLLNYRNRHTMIQLRSPVRIDGVVKEISGNFVRLEDCTITGTANDHAAAEVWIDLGTIQHWHLV